MTQDPTTTPLDAWIADVRRRRPNIATRFFDLGRDDDLVRALKYIKQLRDALTYYACSGIDECTEVKLKNGQCIRDATDKTCGDPAYCALTEMPKNDA